jgi:ABC-type phosphate transport system permease subunit
MGFAIGLHRQALFATGIVLLAVIVVLNFAATRSIRRKAGSR